MKSSTRILSLFLFVFLTEAMKETRNLEVLTLPKEVPIQGQKLATLPTLGRQFHLSFEFKAEKLDTFQSILEFRKDDLGTILALRAAKDDKKDGMKFQLSAKFGGKQATKSKSSVDNYASKGLGKYCEEPFLLNPKYDWIAVEVSTRHINDFYEPSKNGDEDYLLTLKIRKTYENDDFSSGIENNIDFYYSKLENLHNIEVYAGSSKNTDLDGKLRYLNISSESSNSGNNVDGLSLYNETKKLEIVSLPEQVEINGTKLVSLPCLEKDFQMSFEFRADTLSPIHSSFDKLSTIIELNEKETGRTILALRADQNGKKRGMDFQYSVAISDSSSGMSTISPRKSSLKKSNGCLEPVLFNPIDNWVAVEVSARHRDGKDLFKTNLLSIGIRNHPLDARGIATKIQQGYRNPRSLKNIQVYVGSAKDKSLSGRIRNFQIRSVMESDSSCNKQNSGVDLFFNFGVLKIFMVIIGSKLL